jgi:hydrogenase nickel insertion protein HypA
MHELSIIEGVISAILKEKERHHFSRVTGVEIVCGRYNCISESNLQFCFDAVVQPEWMKGARLKVRRLPGKSVCTRCSHEFETIEKGKHRCPRCSSDEIIDIIDNTVYIENLEVQE